MSHKRYANRRDANEPDIIKALEAIGCTVEAMDKVDLVVGYRGQNYLLEVKDGSKPPSKRELTPAQLRLRNSWKGQYSVVTSVDEALAVLKHGAIEQIRKDMIQSIETSNLGLRGL